MQDDYITRYPINDEHTYTRLISLAFATEYPGEGERGGHTYPLVFKKTRQDMIYVHVPETFVREIARQFPKPNYDVSVMHHTAHRGVKVRVKQLLPVDATG